MFMIERGDTIVAEEPVWDRHSQTGTCPLTSGGFPITDGAHSKRGAEGTNVKDRSALAPAIPAQVHPWCIGRIYLSFLFSFISFYFSLRYKRAFESAILTWGIGLACSAYRQGPLLVGPRRRI